MVGKQYKPVVYVSTVVSEDQERYPVPDNATTFPLEITFQLISTDMWIRYIQFENAMWQNPWIAASNDFETVKVRTVFQL